MNGGCPHSIIGFRCQRPEGHVGMHKWCSEAVVEDGVTVFDEVLWGEVRR